jgi:fibronectin type 3 domain-containing protein
LTCGQFYNFKVRAVNQFAVPAGNGSFSPTLSLRVTAAAPASAKAASAGYNSIKLSWAAISGATCYKIFRSTSATGAFTLIKTTTATSYTNTGLITGKTYYYWVRASKTIDDCETYGAFSQVSAKPIPGTPASFNIVSAGNNSVNLAWNAVAGASGYQVYRATSATGTYSLIHTNGPTTTSYQNCSLTKGTTYWYKVRAYRISGLSRIYSSFTTARAILVP